MKSIFLLSKFKKEKLGMLKWLLKWVLLWSLVSNLSYAEWNYKYDIGIMTGGKGGTYIKFGIDSMKLVAKLQKDDTSNHENRILVRPIVSAGSQNNLMALKKSPGVDLAIVQADVMKVYKESGILGNLIHELRYISYLYNEEIHIAVKKSSSLKYFRDLDTKKMAIGPKGSGTELTANNIITLMGLGTRTNNMGFADSMKALKQGNIDAVIAVGGKPLSKFTPYLNDIRFLSVSQRAMSTLSDSYVEATLNQEDYTGVTDTIDTIAVPSILACYNWKKKHKKRYSGMKAYVTALHDNLDIFQEIGKRSNNKKWLQIDFRKNVPGWKRHSLVSYYDRVIRRTSVIGQE